LLPVEKRAAFVQRVAAALAAGETSVLGAIAAAQRSCLSAPPVASWPVAWEHRAATASFKPPA
jgi:hypothetical protein